MLARTCLLVFLAGLLAACGAVQVPPTPTVSPIPSATATPIPTDTPQLTPALEVFTETVSEAPTNTPEPAAVTATMDPLVATSVALMGPMGALTDLSQYYHPVGAPVKTWRDVPVMTQATAGQEYPPYIYSYTANSTLDQARQFYTPLLPSLGIVFPPGSGTAGTGADAIHNVAFLSPTVGIVLTSFDNDPAHVIVVISKAP